MGQATSSNSESALGPDLQTACEPENRIEPVVKIDTAKKLQSQLSYEFRWEQYYRTALRNALNFGLDTAYGKSEGQISWGEHDLVDFLSFAVPVKLKADLDVAGPLLLKAMMRLGQFPFHNGQTPSTLGADEFFVACFFLQRRYEEYSQVYADEWDNKTSQKILDRWFHRLLFQVMSNKPDFGPWHELQGEDKHLARNPADDEDLIMARTFVEERNYARDMKRPTVRIQLPPVIEISELPSSRSRDLTGTVPKEEFRALIRVLWGIHNYTSTDIWVDVVDQLIETHGTDWHGFEAMLIELEPRFSSEISSLLNELYRDRDREMTPYLEENQDVY